MPGTLDAIGALLNNGIPFVNSFLNNPTVSGLPRGVEQVGGAAALISGMRNTPTLTIPDYTKFQSPYGTSAVNYLEDAYTSPADPFAPGGVSSQYMPYIQQQEKALLDDAQQRIISGLPGGLSTSMGGGEIESIRSSISNYLLPQRYKLFGDLQRENLDRQMRAAAAVYGGEGEKQLAMFRAAMEAELAKTQGQMDENQWLRQMGLMMLLGGNPQGAALLGGSGGTGTAGGTGGSGLGSALQSFLGGGAGGGNPFQSLLGLVTGGQTFNPAQGAAFTQAVSQALGGIPIGGFEAAGGDIAILGQNGQILGGVLRDGTVINGATGQAVGNVAAGTGPFAQLSSLIMPALQLAGGGLLAWQSPKIGQNQFQSTALGIAGGALAGSVFGPVGTAVGAIAGALRGFFGERSQQHELKEQFRNEDLDSQADQVQEIGSWLTQNLSKLGVDTGGFQQFVSQMISDSSAGAGSYSYGGFSSQADQQEALSQIGGQVLLQAIKQTNPTITSLNQVPGLRAEFIDYLTRSTFTSSNSTMRGGAPTDRIPQWASMVGLAKGGSLPLGGTAIVGESAPELLIAGPGTRVLPMKRNVDGSFGFDASSQSRVFAPNGGAMMPAVTRAIEGPPLTAEQNMIARPALPPQAASSIIQSLRAQGAFPNGASMAIPTGGIGRSDLLRALMMPTRRRRMNVESYA